MIAQREENKYEKVSVLWVLLDQHARPSWYTVEDRAIATPHLRPLLYMMSWLGHVRGEAVCLTETLGQAVGGSKSSYYVRLC